MFRPGQIILLLIAAIFAAALTVPAQDSLPELVRRIKPSAVAIETYDARGNSVSRGSGFFIGYDRIITNRHVIERANRVEVHLMDGRKFPVRGVLAVDGEGDLALLKVEIPKELSTPLPIGDRVPLEGESIVVVGNPFGLEGSVSNGIVSAVRDIAGYGRIIQITAPISAGSSGSPVVNMYGQVIGVATLQAAEGQSLNFAVPAERIKQLRVGDIQTVSNHSADTLKSKRAAAERFYSQGVAQLSRDDYERALPFFERAVELDPGYTEAWYQAGFCYGVLGRHEDALRASNQAAKLRPDWAETHVNIGASNYALGRYKEAVASYREAIRLDDDNADTQYALGLSLGKLDNTDEEMLAYRRALVIRPDHANALEKLADAYVKKKRWDDAIAALEQLKIYKPDARTYNALGEAYLESDKPDDSLAAFNNAVGYDPEFGRARYNLGRAYLKIGSRDMALVQYQILRSARSDWADRLLALIEN